MKIRLYLPVWNEEKYLPLTLKHYGDIVDDVVVLDNYSTDRTVEVALDHGCIVKRFGTRGVFDDIELLRIKEFCWLEARRLYYDFVFVCDCDEILQITKQQIYDEYTKGTNVFRTRGFNMHSLRFPTYSYDEVERATPSAQYSKSILFAPTQIQAINYSIGAHTARPKGNVVYSQGVYPLYHYKFIGGPDRLVARHKECAQRMSERNIERGWSWHYREPEEKMRADFENQYSASQPIHELL